MASDAQMREQIKNAYPTSKRWGDKVDRMPSHQVAAVYFRLLDEKRNKEHS